MPAGGKIVWNGDKIKTAIEKDIAKKLAVAAEIVRKRAVKKISISGWGLRNRMARWKRAEYKLKKQDINAQRSKLFDATLSAKTNRQVRKFLKDDLDLLKSEYSRYKKNVGKNQNYLPSDPGDPPHARTGRLRQSVFYVVMAKEGYAIVGTNLPYGRPLEVGTSKMRARPWLHPSLLESMSEVKAIFAKPLPKKS